jgi:hypothetical protein
VLRAASAVEGLLEQEVGPAPSDARSQIEAAFRRTVIMG